MSRPRVHTIACDADGPHAPLDCATASELARLRAFAEAVRDEFTCLGAPVGPTDDVPLSNEVIDDLQAAHRDDCWHCAAEQALEGAR
jgi:hypothetical protein